MASREIPPKAWGPAPAQGPVAGGKDLWGRFRETGLGPLAGLMILAIVVTALLVPLLPLADPIAPDYDQVLAPPGSGHVLGTDLHGRDQLSRTLWAARTSLLVGLVATGLALAAGVTVGSAAVYSGRFIDPLLMRAADIFLSFPAVVGAVAIMAVLGPGVRNVFLAIAFFGWPIFARIFRSSLLSTKEMGYVKAAQGLGAGEGRIFFVHVLPNSISPLAAYSALAVAGAILAEAGLSFINLGVQRPHPSWGLMLAESIGQFDSAPWLAIVPGVAVTLTTLAFILLGAALTRAIDPRASRAAG